MKSNKSFFLGSKRLGLEILKAMHKISPESIVGVATLDDANDGRGCLEMFHEFCDQNKIELHVTKKPRDLINTIDTLKPDICIVNGYYRILGKEILDRFPLGCVGIHGSLLPLYRGGSPLVWSIINGDKTSGISLFYFDEGMDSGDIIDQKQFRIEDDDSIQNILTKVEGLSIRLIKENYKKLLNGDADRITQEHDKASYVAMRQQSDGKINWQWPASRIYDFIRAQTKPYPGAFTLTSSGEKITIWKARVFNSPYFGSPGKVVRILNGEVVITCGFASAIVVEKIASSNGEDLTPSKAFKFNQQLP